MNCKNCWHCLEGQRNEYGFPVVTGRMIVCAECGNKRCPHATDHRLKCTNSNETDQPGSMYSNFNYRTDYDF
jgi:hypothetical protein